jgi:uncharacterized RDD family membrane protein YckC
VTATPTTADPLQPRPSLNTAGIVSRSAALAVDVVVFAALSAGSLFFLQAATALVHTEPFGSATVEPGLAGAAIAVLVVVYFAGAWAITGRTVGEALLGLRVVRPDGGKVSLVRSVVRCAMTFVSAAACWIGFGWILIDRERRTWQDIVARTIVVYSFGRYEREVVVVEAPPGGPLRP